MLNNTSSKIRRIGKFVKDEKTFKILLLFKLLKSEAEKKHLYRNDELNKHCIIAAKKIVDEGRDNPTSKDIADLLEKLKKLT